MGRWRFAPPSKPSRTWSADSSTMPCAWRRSTATPASVTSAKSSAVSISASGVASARPAMTERIVEGYRRAPSALNFMSRALRRSPGLANGAVIPPIAVQWNGVPIEPAQLEGFCRDTGLRADAGVPVLFPQVVGFRLQMALLTHPAYPLPIWTALQVRNRLVRHVHVEPGEILDLRTHVGEQRTVEKGIEVDLVSRLMRGPVCCWEGRTTCFHRGRFGMPSSLEPRAVSPDLSEVPPVDRFRMPGGGGWAFGKLTGDYNGIHCWNWYARRFGFP